MADNQATELKTRNERIKKTGLSLEKSAPFGKLPPQAPDLEEIVLGAMMLEKDVVSAVIDILKPDSFYMHAHRLIFTAMSNLFERSQPIDIKTVTHELKRMGELETAGGTLKVAELTSRVGSSAHAEFHARIIAQKFVQRELIRISSQIIEDAYEDTTDVFDLLDRAEKGLFEVTDQNLRRNYASMSTLIADSIHQIELLREKGEGMTGVPSGFAGLDRHTNGWQRSDLIIVAARPGMGKTAFTLSMARNAAVEHGKNVAVFSLEMSATQLVTRLISAEAELSADVLRKGNLASYQWTQLTTKVRKLSEAQIFIDETPAINIFELRAKCRRLKSNHNIDMVIIDYLQLMQGTVDGKNSNREQEISQISRALKGIAKELDIPVIALSQLNRSVETRGGDKRPQLSDLRESGAIEQDADMVLFLYRPEYYNLTEDESGRSLEGMAEIIIAKHRNGALDTVMARFIGQYAKFTDLDANEWAQFNDDGYGDNSLITKSSKMNQMGDGMGSSGPEDIGF